MKRARSVGLNLTTKCFDDDSREPEIEKPHKRGALEGVILFTVQYRAVNIHELGIA